MPEKVKGKVGRPTKLTPALAKKIADAYSTAVGLAHAARTFGVHPETAYKWVKENPGFAGMIAEARSKAITVAMNKMRGVDTKWWLQQADKKRFGDPTKRLEVAVDTGAGVSEAVRFARELLTNDAAREHLEAAGRLLFATTAEPGDVRDGVEPGALED